MNMYQLEKHKLLYELCFDFFSENIANSDFDFYELNITEVDNDFLSMTAHYQIKYESIIYDVKFDDNEQITVYSNDTQVCKYEIIYHNVKSISCVKIC